MKKVAILTTHRANNFGAVLQAFSLVTKCRELGADAEILDWRTPLFEWQYYNPWRQMSRNPSPGFRYALRYLLHEGTSRRLFSEFRRKLPLSQKIETREGLQSVAKEYEAFIVGSDQVWNPGQTARDPRKFDRAYLLDFVTNGRKYAYAASIGKETINPPDLIPEYQAAWEGFDLITMREAAGAEFVSKTIGRKVEVVLDPVLLHDAVFWRGKESPRVTPHEAYVLVYNVQHYRPESQWMVSEAQRYAKEFGCRIVNLFVPGALTRWTPDSIQAGPAEFVHLIDNAKAVFTNSFHASAFSIILGKEMFLHISHTPHTTNTRFETLSSYAHFPMKEVASYGGSEHIFRCECAERVGRGLDQMKGKSIKILNDMLRCDSPHWSGRKAMI